MKRKLALATIAALMSCGFWFLVFMVQLDEPTMSAVSLIGAMLTVWVGFFVFIGGMSWAIISLTFEGTP